MNEILRFENISKSFYGVPVLREVGLSLGEGRVLGLVGENGAGKSTLMNILGGVVQPDGGNMWLHREPYTPRNPSNASESGVAFIHQELNLFPNLTVGENLLLGDFPRSVRSGGLFIDRKRTRERARKLLREVHLDVSPDTPVEDLSPGEQQLVEIAKALSFNARIVIFDEPTTSLTALEAEHLFTLIARLRARGISIIYISHILDDVFRLSDEVTVLRDGEVAGGGPAGKFTREELISLMVGRKIEQLYPSRSQEPDAAAVLEVKDVSHPGIARGISLRLHKREILGIYGLMGSGRTELARMVFGLDPHQEGEVRLHGRVLAKESVRESIARGLAFLTENRRGEGLLMEASVGDNMALVALDRYSRTAAKIVNQSRLGAAAENLSQSLRVRSARMLQQVVKTLSGGNQQKVVFGKWLLSEPSVFILDEPTRGVDVGAKSEIYGIIAGLADRGAGILLISSEIEELIGMCDRILVMREGEIIGEVPRPQFNREAILSLALKETSLA
jgi:ribose transport system ATP-binding protein